MSCFSFFIVSHTHFAWNCCAILLPSWWHECYEIQNAYNNMNINSNEKFIGWPNDHARECCRVARKNEWKVVNNFTWWYLTNFNFIEQIIFHRFLIKMIEKSKIKINAWDYYHWNPSNGRMQCACLIHNTRIYACNKSFCGLHNFDIGCNYMWNGLSMLFPITPAATSILMTIAVIKCFYGIRHYKLLKLCQKACSHCSFYEQVVD